MTIQTYWQIDVAAEPARSEISARATGAGLFRDVRTTALNRYDYYAQIAQAAAQTAFDGVFIPHRPQSDDAAIVAAAIAREVPRIGLIAEFPASAGSAVYAAKQAVSFQRLARERLGWSIAPSLFAGERIRDGDRVADDDLIARTKEFLDVARGVHGERPYSYAGRFFEVQGGGFEAPLDRVAFPRVFLQGESEEALALSARSADVHLFVAQPLAALRSQIEALDALTLREGRPVAFGLVQPVLAREDGNEARRDAARAGIGEFGLVGDYDEVATRLAELARLGVSHFVLSASPSLEEAYAVGQHLLPRFRLLSDQLRAAA
jgi:alkanesulfonate monooxygenase